MWTVFIRASALLSTMVALRNLLLEYTTDLKKYRIYTSEQVATLLGLTRKEVVGLIREEKIRATMIEGNYRIPGWSVISYLKGK